jgi:hypothetical protein
MGKKYFLDQDNDGHWYMIDADHEDKWNDWLELDSDDEASWNVPEFAEGIDSPRGIKFYLRY